MSNFKSLIVCAFLVIGISIAFAQKRVITEKGKYGGKVEEEILQPTNNIVPNIQKITRYYSLAGYLTEEVEEMTPEFVEKTGVIKRTIFYSNNVMGTLIEKIETIDFSEIFADTKGNYTVKKISYFNKNGILYKQINVFSDAFTERNGYKWTESIFNNANKLIRITYYTKYGTVKGVEKIN